MPLSTDLSSNPNYTQADMAKARDAWNVQVERVRAGELTYHEAAHNAVVEWDKILHQTSVRNKNGTVDVEATVNKFKADQKAAANNNKKDKAK